MKLKRICFVDDRNIFRSKLAEYLFNQQTNTNLTKAYSRGCSNTSPKYKNFSSYPDYLPCKKVLEKFGVAYKFNQTNYRLIQPKDFRWFDFFITMDQVTQTQLQKTSCHKYKIISPDRTGVEIFDPVFSDENKYAQVVGNIIKLVNQIIVLFNIKRPII